jgi:hypothetical protein
MNTPNQAGFTKYRGVSSLHRSQHVPTAKHLTTGLLVVTVPHVHLPGDSTPSSRAMQEVKSYVPPQRCLGFGGGAPWFHLHRRHSHQVRPDKHGGVLTIWWCTAGAQLWRCVHSPAERGPSCCSIGKGFTAGRVNSRSLLCAEGTKGCRHGHKFLLCIQTHGHHTSYGLPSSRFGSHTTTWSDRPMRNEQLRPAAWNGNFRLAWVPCSTVP